MEYIRLLPNTSEPSSTSLPSNVNTTLKVTQARMVVALGTKLMGILKQSILMMSPRYYFLGTIRFCKLF